MSFKKTGDAPKSGKPMPVKKEEPKQKKGKK